MGRYMHHRGPDAWGEWAHDGIVLGHNRLSILDIEGGRQPMLSSTGNEVIVFNGEIYNFREIRREIRRDGGLLHTDHSDTEAIIEGYRLWGASFFSRLDGMFAFAIWNLRDRTLLLVRDRVGIKPLYYARLADGGMAFASEPKALVGSGVIRARLDEGSIEGYFVFRSPLHPGTMFRGVQKVAAGTIVSFVADTQRLEQSTYHSVISDARFAGPRPGAAEVEAAVDAAVRSQLVADVEVGLFLSGGVDSSLLAYLASGHQSIRAFTVSSPGPLDEAMYAKQVAERVGIDLTVEDVTAASMLAALDDWVYFNDDPVGDPSALALMILSRRVHATGLKVVLAGEGADELFGGYISYARYVLALGAAKIHSPLFADLSAALDFRLHDYLSQPDSPYWGSAHVTNARMRRSLLGSTSARLVSRMRETGGDQSPLRRAMQVDLALRLPNDLLMRTDRATMASSLEARVPFLANRVLELSRELTDSQLMRVLPYSSKRLLKGLTAAHVGRDVVYRRKVGFDLPIAKWLSGPFSRRIEGMLQERMIDCLNYEVISTWYGQLRKGKAILAPVIWSWFTLELWFRKWVVAPSSPLIGGYGVGPGVKARVDGEGW